MVDGAIFLALVTSIICLVLAIGCYLTDEPVEPTESEQMGKLQHDLYIANMHFDEAVTQDEIDAAVYEVLAAHRRIDEFRKRVKV